jgi:hypothetical protein
VQRSRLVLATGGPTPKSCREMINRVRLGNLEDHLEGTVDSIRSFRVPIRHGFYVFPLMTGCLAEGDVINERHQNE